jgi:hypothetical protein
MVAKNESRVRYSLGRGGPGRALWPRDLPQLRLAPEALSVAVAQ